MKILLPLLVFVFILTSCSQPEAPLDEVAGVDFEITEVAGRWTPERINAWYDAQPWLVGCNYYPATAINQIEMWQASTWDPTQIRKELGWAAGIGMNTLRVYLHDKVWADDEEGLYQRMDQFLDICAGYDIRPFFVFFDDCHYPDPQLGIQPLPVRAYHNSGWMNSPAREVALLYARGETTAQEEANLRNYVMRTMDRFRDDDRVLMWELYNEPGRGQSNDGSGPQPIGELSNRLVHNTWVWARAVNPSQPITSTTHGCVGERNIAINRANSDLHSIHPYGPVSHLIDRINEYKKDGRPVMVTEWLSRINGSTVADCLPVMKELNVGAINWGFVAGKSNTIWPWSSRNDAQGNQRSLIEERQEGNVIRPGEPFPEPDLWFHDLFRMDGTPFDPAEIELFRQLTSVAAQ